MDQDLPTLEAVPTEATQVSLLGFELTPGGLRHLAGLPSLTHLSANWSKLDDDGLALLEGAKITSLDLSSARKITEEGLRHLAGLPSLQSLRLRDVTDVGLAHLVGHPSLESLELHYEGSATGLLRLAEVPRLRSLRVGAQDEHVRSLASLPLRELDLEPSSWLSDLAPLRATKLERLKLPTSGPPSMDVADLVRAIRTLRHLEGITWGAWLLGDLDLDLLTLSRPELDDSELPSILHFENLQTLATKGYGITDTGLPRLAELTQLHTLELIGCRVTGSGLAALRDLPLQSLTLRGTPLAPEAIEHLAALTGLHTLVLEDCRVQSSGLSRLAALRELRVLGLRENDVTEEPVTELVRALPHLTRLDVCETGIADPAGLRAMRSDLTVSWSARGTRVAAMAMAMPTPKPEPVRDHLAPDGGSAPRETVPFVPPTPTLLALLTPFWWTTLLETAVAQHEELQSYLANGSVAGRPFIGLRHPPVLENAPVPARSPSSLLHLWSQFHMASFSGGLDVLDPDGVAAQSRSLTHDHLALATRNGTCFAADLRESRPSGEYAISSYDAAHGWSLEEEHAWSSLEELVLDHLCEDLEAFGPDTAAGRTLVEALREALRTVRARHAPST